MSETIVPIRRALFSVFDKQGLVELARVLVSGGTELMASGGTRSTLREAGLEVIEVAEYTGQPEVLGGRVKTLHPKIHGGILARRDLPEDLATLDRQGILPIDLVVVNLYPFEATIARPDASWAEAIENIDIGGPTLIRAAAKNHAHVAVLTSPAQYDPFIKVLRDTRGTALKDRRLLALAAFRTTWKYDQSITHYLDRVLNAEAGNAEPFPSELDLHFRLRQPLRYGENPQQLAAFYVEPTGEGPNLATAILRHGKELSYNNLLDLDNALRLVRQFAEPAACVLKHNNPCGAAVAPDAARAFERAYEGDPLSAFGGIVGLNRRVDRAVAELMCWRPDLMKTHWSGFEPNRPGGTVSAWSTWKRRLTRSARIHRDLTTVASRGDCSFRAGIGSSPIPPRERWPRRDCRQRQRYATWRSRGASARRSSQTRLCWPRTVRL
jgi:phosphoribosylaminoimidazolecarboxamide formyltransferase/IMP cyclohydrolase